MCRNIRPLFNFDPPATDDEVRGAALQFVRKISGYNKPSQINEAAFVAAVDRVAAVSRELLATLETNAPPKNREAEAGKRRERSVRRYPPAHALAGYGMMQSSPAGVHRSRSRLPR